MPAKNSENIQEILIVGLTPYFLEKPDFWFDENTASMLEAAKSQSFFKDNVFLCQKNQEYNFSQFLRRLDELGYEKVAFISEPGEFSRRGGIIDVFPVNLLYAVRLEFYGNLLLAIEQLPLAVTDGQAARKLLLKKIKRQKIFSDLSRLAAGDYIVHLDHGIGRFLGREKAGKEEYYILGYAQNDKLYIPTGLERKLSRYVGFAEPKISRLSSPLWGRTKNSIKEETEKTARELLELYAHRELAQRPPYAPDEEILQKLSSTFPFPETPDQFQTIEEIRKDLKKDRPMERIVCGDVGFGKTEIALRTAVLAATSGYQCALICPTTILAYQHYKTFLQRIDDLPIKIALLSRLQSSAGQKRILEQLAAGDIDILIGTHRMLSSDVEFKNLGLLIIDDEQRFGVKQKEKLKKLKASLDVLSLSATPIPRTLYLALSSLKKISVMQTPPIGRMAVKTFVSPWKEDEIKRAITNELSRKGQIYYLHNRVETIEKARRLIQKLAPEAHLGVAHGRLREKELIAVMEAFQNKKIDVLISTTIIENGLDLANANTLIVADAAKLGLAQAHQIRGRVGRSHTQAFSYFFFGQRLSETAKKRLTALREAEELGSGYRLALKDLEIRGAGNILGKQQSGSVNQVGLNLYCQMLSDAVEKLKIVRTAP